RARLLEIVARGAPFATTHVTEGEEARRPRLMLRVARRACRVHELARARLRFVVLALVVVHPEAQGQGVAPVADVAGAPARLLAARGVEPHALPLPLPDEEQRAGQVRVDEAGAAPQLRRQRGGRLEVASS